MRRVGAGVAALTLWGLGGLWAGPVLIRRAYNEETLEVLNRVISGRGTHPVETYLDAWWSMFLWSTPAVAMLLLAYLFPDGRARAIERLIGGTPDLKARTLIWLAAWLGLLGGLGEALYLGLRQWELRAPAFGPHTELFWMAPVSSGLAGLCVGCVMAVVARLGSTRWHVGKAMLPLCFGAAYAVVQSERIPLHPAAAVVLSLGLASVLARLSASRAVQLDRLVTAGRPYLAVLVLGAVAYGSYTLPSVAERRALQDRPAARASAPNILLIILDTVRAANLSLYGYERPTTPRLDEWAEAGTVFESAVATAPWTLPTHASLFTGQYNYVNATAFYAPLDDPHSTLSELLSAQGYATAGFTANLIYTNHWSGLDRGFDRWEDHIPSVGMFLESSWIGGLLARPFVGRHSFAKSAAAVTERFAGWLATRPDRPFFVFINFFDAHDPIRIPSGFAGRFGPLPSETTQQLWGRWQSVLDEPGTPQRTRLWVNKYDDAIAYIDHHLGIIRDVLTSRGLLDNTIVVVTADHGEMWGEHGIIGHTSALYEELVHVPLLITFPPSVPAGRRVDMTVSLRDVPATILELAGLGDVDFPGQSLLSLEADPKVTPVPSPALSEVDFEGNNSPVWTPVSRGDMKSLHWGDFHYILNGDGVEELYDLTVDPSEQNDLHTAPEFEPTMTLFRVKLDSLLSH